MRQATEFRVRKEREFEIICPGPKRVFVVGSLGELWESFGRGLVGLVGWRSLDWSLSGRRLQHLADGPAGYTNTGKPRSAVSVRTTHSCDS